VPVASRLAVYEEALGDGEAGLLFEPNDLETLTAQLGRLVVDGDLRERLRAAARPRPWSVVADELEELYARWRRAATAPAATPRSPAACRAGA
jgi:glycosyltransferase involved in cell wall biosynthesis